MKRGFVVVLILSLAHPLLGQQGKDEAEKDKSKDNLPPIVLPEFDITGKEQPVPPDFSKGEYAGDQGLSPMIRNPNLDERENTALDAGKKPELPVGKSPGLVSGKVVVGYGRFVTPSIESWLGLDGTMADVNVSGRFTSSDGHVAFSDYRRGGLDASVSWKLGREAPILKETRLLSFAGFEGDRYRFYGSPTPDLVRTTHHGSLGVGTSSLVGPWGITEEAKLRWHYYSVSDVAKSTENELSLSFTASKTFGDVTTNAGAEFAADFLGASLSADGLAYGALHIGAAGEVIPGFHLEGGVAVYSLKNTDTATGVRFYPQVEARYIAGEFFTVFARTVPEARKSTLRGLLGDHPYLASSLAIRHQESDADFAGGVEVTLSARARGRVAISYRRLRNYPVYLDEDRNGMWGVTYDGKTRLLSLTTDASVRLSDDDQVLASVRLLESEYSVTGDRVPYLPSIVFSGTYQRQIGSRMNLQGSLQVVGRRNADLSSSRTLDSYVRLDLRGEYYFSKSIGVSLSTENTFDQRYELWENYIARPFSIQAGLTARW